MNLGACDVIESSFLEFQYDCCAVREVQGSTNDFVNTPWCTKYDSCSAKSSKIPKTCCKDVTQDDYQNAPPTCYVSVNPGTYKQVNLINGYNVKYAVYVANNKFRV